MTSCFHPLLEQPENLETYLGEGSGWPDPGWVFLFNRLITEKMAKELPYFKFEPNQWENGNIQYFNRSVKGLFIDLCSMYWSRLGELDYALALQKLCNGNTSELDLLMQKDIFVIVDDKIVIEFLDEQLNEFQETSLKRTGAANKRWENKGKNANAMQVQCKSNAIREDKIREDNIKKESNKEKRKSDFSKILQTISENYDQDVLNDFFNYWTESGINDQKMRFEKEKSFDVNLRLKTWIKNQKKWEVQKNTNQGPRPHQENAGVLLLKKYGIR